MRWHGDERGVGGGDAGQPQAAPPQPGDLPELLERARRRAHAEGLEAAFLEGEAEDLPFPDSSFEVVLSAGDAMSIPGQVGELLRVCRPGGRIGMVGWTPDGYVGQLLARSFLWRFPSAEHQVAFLASFHGPTVQALQALEPDRADALEAELLDVARHVGAPRSLSALRAYARTAARLGYRYLCANDHLVFGRAWLDGPTVLAALVEASRDMLLVTTAGLPVLRGPVQLAKTLAALDILSGGRLVAGVGPGSSADDYAAVGIGFQKRWRRFDKAVQALRALLHGDPAGFEGGFYSTRGVLLEPRPVQRPGPPIWVASWGSRPGCAGSPASARAGSPPPTTPRRTGSARPWTGSPRSWRARAGRPARPRPCDPPRC